MKLLSRSLIVLFCALLTAPSFARVTDILIQKRELLPAEVPTGNVGQYERIEGIVHYALDPTHPENAKIVDLDKAPRNAQGLVTFRGNFTVFQPVDPAKRRGVAWVEVSNRGGKAGFRYFQAGARGEGAEAYGDGLLFQEGLTLIWVGWQFDVPHDDDALWINAPIARGEGGNTITGLARSDWVVDEAVSRLGLAHRTMLPLYRAVDFNDESHVLTRRPGRHAAREIVGRDKWHFSTDGTAIEGDFAPGFIYELVYKTQHPYVVGVGLTAIRDFASYVKYQPENPFKVERAIAFGVSQTGRFLRHFLYQGFNADEEGRMAYDGMFIHTAGAGRGSFNHRFAQPSRDAHRYSAFAYPTDIYPFASEALPNEGGSVEEGWLDALNDTHVPRIFATNTGYEYWGRAAALIHSDWRDGRDSTLHPNERIYHIAGGQHFVGRIPEDLSGTTVGNPLGYFPILRALAIRHIDWVDKGEDPPESLYPRMDKGELVPYSEVAYPIWLGIDTPPIPHSAYFADYGPRWKDGIIDHQPPHLSREIIPLVPQVDDQGNELGGVRLPQLEYPVASFLPWSQRNGKANPNELNDFQGRIIALPALRNDILEGSKNAAEALVKEGFLLPQDVSKVLMQQEQLLKLRGQP